MRNVHIKQKYMVMLHRAHVHALVDFLSVPTWINESDKKNWFIHYRKLIYYIIPKIQINIIKKKS